VSRPASAVLNAALLFGALVPLALLLTWSLSLRWYFPALAPQEFTTRAWADLLSSDSSVWAALRGSLWTAGVTAVLATLIALPAARRLARERGRVRLLMGALILAPLALPAFAGVMGVQIVFVRLGLADTPLGVVAAHLVPATPYAALLLTGTFERYDARHEAVARSLGASRGVVFRRVTLPLLLPGVLVAALLAFLVSWGEYLLTLIVGGGAVMTLPLLLLASAGGGDLAVTAALSLLYVTPAVLIFALIATRLRGWSA